MSKRKTNTIMVSVLGAAVTLMAGCSANTNETLPNKPNDPNCNEWVYDKKTGTYQCDDTQSNYHGHYHYGGSYFPTAQALTSSSSYKNGVASGLVKPAKSGFGSGTKGGGFGG